MLLISACRSLHFTHRGSGPQPNGDRMNRICRMNFCLKPIGEVHVFSVEISNLLILSILFILSKIREFTEFDFVSPL
jgi:hypothetical protein